MGSPRGLVLGNTESHGGEGANIKRTSLGSNGVPVRAEPYLENTVDSYTDMAEVWAVLSRGVPFSLQAIAVGSREAHIPALSQTPFLWREESCCFHRHPPSPPSRPNRRGLGGDAPPHLMAVSSQGPGSGGRSS